MKIANRSTVFLLLCFITVTRLVAQWSTSAKTQDALFACPGFTSRNISYQDGSSIIIGIGDQNEIWMQKLDQYGYKQWLPWISVFPSISGQRTFLPDDDGGIYAIIGSVAQRVDKYGNLRWGANGKMIIPRGNISKAVTDGKNGFIALYNNYDSSMQRITVFRYDSAGTKLWEKQIDSSNVQGSITGDITGRLEKKTLLNTSKGECKLIDLNGQMTNVDTTYLYNGVFVKETDTTGFNVQGLSFKSDSLGYLLNERTVKLSGDWDTIWTSAIEFREVPGKYLGTSDSNFPDGLGSIFRFLSYYDNSDIGYTRINRISREGIVGEVLIKGLAGRYFFNSTGKLGFVNDFMQAQLVDTNGNKLWPDSFSVISDYNDAFFIRVASDNHGGAVLSFWTVAGGIKVQHTGRIGKVGVLTKVSQPGDKIPNAFFVYQNYPNPFNTSTTIKFSLPKETTVELKIFDALGREVQELLNEKLSEGIYEVRWDATSYSSGIYFYSIKSGSSVKTHKMVLLK